MNKIHRKRRLDTIMCFNYIETYCSKSIRNFRIRFFPGLSLIPFPWVNSTYSQHHHGSEYVICRYLLRRCERDARPLALSERNACGTVRHIGGKEFHSYTHRRIQHERIRHIAVIEAAHSTGCAHGDQPL